MTRFAALPAETLLVTAAILLALGALGRSAPALRLAVLTVAVLLLAWALARGHRVPVASAATVLLLAACAPLLARRVRQRLAPFSAEEEAMVAQSLPGVPRGIARGLLDQGLWLHGQAGEALLTEGQPVSHLFYLSAGAVQVVSGGQQIATSGPGHFFGELDVLAHTPAIAGVTLMGAGRFWCIAAGALEAYLAANPELRPPLEIALHGEMREKLRERHRRIVQLGAGR